MKPLLALISASLDLLFRAVVENPLRAMRIAWLGVAAVLLLATFVHFSGGLYRATLLVQHRFSRILVYLGIRERPVYVFDKNNFRRLTPVIHKTASKHGVDPDLIKAVIFVESKFNSDAVSRAGALGLMQLMPGTAAEMGALNPFSEQENIEAGTRYLGSLLKRFRGSLPLALAGYNAGPQKVREHGGIPPFRETRAFVRRVLSAYSQLKKWKGERLELIS